LFTVAKLSSGSAVFVSRLGHAKSYDRTQKRQWSPYSASVIRGFAVPGVASVNGPYYDWPFVAGYAFDAWQHNRKVFKAWGFDGPSKGLDKFYSFTCRVTDAVIQCANVLGDSMKYLPKTPSASSHNCGTVHSINPQSYSGGVSVVIEIGSLPCEDAREVIQFALGHVEAAGAAYTFRGPPGWECSRGVFPLPQVRVVSVMTLLPLDVLCDSEGHQQPAHNGRRLLFMTVGLEGTKPSKVAARCSAYRIAAVLFAPH
jgi:hypothetical protein